MMEGGGAAAGQARAEGQGELGRAELKDVIDSVQEAIVVLDVGANVLSMNRAAVDLHGCGNETDCRMTLEEYLARFEELAPDGRALTRDERPLARALRGEPVHAVEAVVRDVQTGRRWVGLHSAVAFVTSEGRRLVTVTIHDVTELNRAVQALRESDRRKDELLSMLSHELRTPLAPIRSAVFLLDRAVPDSDGARRAREVIARQVAHLTRLVDDLLDVSRLSRGRIELRRARIDLADLVRRTAEDHRDLLGASDVGLDLQLPSHPVSVYGDSTRLAQVLGSLLQNAAKFTGRGGRVTVSLAVKDGTAELRVQDTGRGIEPALVQQVFEPFVQGEETLARTRGGLGLGLALVKGLVELHGGEVSARSDGPGAGAEFTARLPLADAGAPEGVAADEGPGAAHARRVLVVDDNVDAAWSLSDVVAHFGHTVDVVHDGPTAVARVREVHPDVVLCDIGLPGMDGYEVARAVRADAGLKDVRLVAVSGYAQAEDRERAARAGFDDHVAKPADPETIARILA